MEIINEDNNPRVIIDETGKPLDLDMIEEFLKGERDHD